MEDKKVLFIMPVYNKEQHVSKAISSVLQQTHQNFHLVVIDDKSTDSSLDIVKTYRHHPKITILENKENRGCYFSRNRGLDYIEKVNADLYTIHDSDDISSKNRVERILTYFRDSSLLGLKTTYMRVDPEMRPILKPNGQKDIYSSEGIAVFNRDAFYKLGYYDNTRYSGDTDYWWRLEAYCRNNPGRRVCTDDKISYLAVVDGTNLTHKYKIENRTGYFKKIKEEIENSMVPKNNFYRNKFE